MSYNLTFKRLPLPKEDNKHKPLPQSSDMQFEYDPERLIEEVRKRPGIWNFDDVKYRTKESRLKLWKEIVEELLQDNVEVTKSEMRELELQLQRKWKSIKDCFQKYVQNPNRTRRPYIYSKQLQFLLAKPETSGQAKGSDESDEERRPVAWMSSRRKRVKITTKTEYNSDENTENETTQQEDTSTFYQEEETTMPEPKISKTVTKPAFDEFVFANVQQNTETEDTDKMFLLSLLPHLKAIPEEYRLNVKVELMQVLRQANLDLIV